LKSDDRAFVFLFLTYCTWHNVIRVVGNDTKIARVSSFCYWIMLHCVCVCVYMCVYRKRGYIFFIYSPIDRHLYSYCK
jgi:hypothetical protein